MGYISSTPEVLDKLEKSKIIQCGSHVPAPSSLWIHWNCYYL